MTVVSASGTEGGHSVEQPHPFEDSEAIECLEDEAPITLKNPIAIEHEEAPPGPLNTMSEGQEQSFTTSPPSENVLNNTTRYPNKDMIMNEKVSHKNSHLVVYNTLISL